MPGIYVLKGVVKHYDWGGNSFIPALLQVPNTPGKPFAEYWLGIHPLGTALVDTGGSTGTELSVLTPNLPFLLKILDVKEMLSIQVHPDKQTAAEQFAAEEAAGIPADAGNRNYKDPNHKPELSVALGDFWLLHGFKSREGIIDSLQQVSGLEELLPVFQEKGHTGLYQHIMQMPQTAVNQMLEPVLAGLTGRYHVKKPEKSEADYWVMKATRNHEPGMDIDRGIFSIYLMNIVYLKKGEGIFQEPGVLHAYLEGQIVEIMSNSDNVLRGGLTTKHIDIKELLRNVQCEGMQPDILVGDPVNEHEQIYHTPYPDFTLRKIELEAGDTYSFLPEQAELILLTSGKTELDDDRIALPLKAGSPAALVFPGETVYLAAASKSTIFRASGTVNNG